MKNKKKPKNYNGKGSIIDSRKDGRLEWRYRHNGKNKSIYAKSYKDLDKKINAYLAEIEAEQQGRQENDYSKMILSEFTSMYVNLFKIQEISKSTLDLYNDAIRIYLKESSIDVSLDSLTTYEIQKFINSFSKKMSYESVKRIKGILNGSLEFGYLNGYIKTNPMKTIRMPAKKNCNAERSRESQFLNQDEMNQLYKLITTNCTDTLLTTVIVLLAYSGLRIGEALALKWPDVYLDDIENSYLKIDKNIRRIKKADGNTDFKINSTIPATVIKEGPTKTESSTRMVPLPNHVVQLLLKYKDYQNTLTQNGNALINANDLIFTTSTGNYLDSQNLQKRFKKFLKKNNFRADISFHSLRHSYASLLINSNVSLKMTSELLGHGSIKTTADIYARNYNNKKFETVKILNLL